MLVPSSQRERKTSHAKANMALPQSVRVRDYAVSC